MNIESARRITKNLANSSLNLSKLFNTSISLGIKIDSERYEIRKNLIQKRSSVYLDLAKNLKEKDNKDNNLIGGILGALGLGGLARGLKGIRAPKSPKMPIMPRMGAVGRLGRLTGPLNVAFAGLDYAGRLGEGQTQTQAISGAVAGSAGAIAGGIAGQALIPIPGVGFVVGSLIGGTLASMASDKITGVDARLREEERRTSTALIKSPFSYSLDKFQSVLNKFAKFSNALSDVCECEKEELGFVPGEALPPAPVPVPSGGPTFRPITEFFDRLTRFSTEQLNKVYEEPDATTKFFDSLNIDPKYRPLVESLVTSVVMGLAAGKGKPVRPARPPSTPLRPKVRPPVQPSATPAAAPVDPVKPVTPVKVPVTSGAKPIRTAQPSAERILRQLDKSTQGTKLKSGEVSTPEGDFIFRVPKKQLKKGSTPEQFFEQQIQLRKQLQEVGPQSSLGIQNNETIIPVPVNGGGGSVNIAKAPTSSEIADKYVQMIQASRFA